MHEPEAVIFCGIPASGKTTFYAERFLHTHVRISQDLLRTRHRRQRFLDACLETDMPFVIDRVHAERAERAPFIASARAHGFRVVGYVFAIDPREAVARNARRTGRARVPVPGVLGALRRLEPPRLEEGFAELLRVRAVDGAFVVERLAGRPPGHDPDMESEREDLGSTVDDIADRAGGSPAAAGGEKDLTGGEVTGGPGVGGADDEVGAGGAGAGRTGGGPGEAGTPN